MAAKALSEIKWYVDKAAKGRAEPGICHSFMASLAAAVNILVLSVKPQSMTSGNYIRLCISETEDNTGVTNSFKIDYKCVTAGSDYDAMRLTGGPETFKAVAK